eukprot:14909747-Alexandrium_andersonii.AAC.1
MQARRGVDSAHYQHFDTRRWQARRGVDSAHSQVALVGLKGFDGGVHMAWLARSIAHTLHEPH